MEIESSLQSKHANDWYDHLNHLKVKLKSDVFFRNSFFKKIIISLFRQDKCTVFNEDNGDTKNYIS